MTAAHLFRSVLFATALALSAAAEGPVAGTSVSLLQRNRLVAEESPFLRQHAASPVEWRAWGPEAFAEAAALKRPVFVTSGYFTCHWCALMDRESFRTPEVAAALNRDTVPVRLDRYERPDLDRLFLAFSEVTTRRSGWPVNVWLTPDGVPFRAVSYLPPDDRGQGTFASVAALCARKWQDDPQYVTKQAPLDFKAALERLLPKADADFRPTRAALGVTFSRIAAQYDPVNGGFDRVPKLPAPARLAFLGAWTTMAGKDSSQAKEAREMVETTLRAMARGGLRDFVGGGFFRYALDDAWQRPYFEKLLLDQGEMARSYVAGFHLTQRREFLAVAAETLAYADRELSSPEGAFYNGEHCDSLPAAGDAPPTEGAYYTWRREDLRRAAGSAGELLDALFGLRDRGNVPPGGDQYRTLGEVNILYTAKPLAEVAAPMKLGETAAGDLLNTGIEALRRERLKRPRPALDRLIVTQSNAVTISALVRTGMALSEPAYLHRAVAAATFVRQRLWNAETGVLHRCCTERPARVRACAEDWATTIEAALDLYEATGQTTWLQWAEELQKAFDTNHQDDKDGGYFDAAHSVKDLPIRFKSHNDGTTFAANATAAANIVRLGAILGEPAYLARAGRVCSAFAEDLANGSRLCAGLALAAGSTLTPPRQLIVIGPPDHPAAAEARLAAARSPGTRRWVVVTLDGAEGQAWLVARNATAGKFPAPPEGGASIFTARDFVVEAGPLTPAAAEAQMNEPSQTN